MDDSSSGRTSLADSTSLATSSSLRSGSSNQNLANDGFIHVFNLLKGDFEKFSPTLLCEEICSTMCRHMEILPTAQLLFGIREHGNSNNNSGSGSNSSSRSNGINGSGLNAKHKWQLPGEHLSCQQRYCFRMRFRVPELDRQLSEIDANCHKYLYHQMRYDMLHEQIQEIRYPDHKDKVMGLAVMDMLIDKEEKQLHPQAVEKLYKNYLPRSLWRAHRIFVRAKIRSTFRQLSVNQPAVNSLKWHYVHQICHLAPTYLTEQFKATVEYFPNESTTEPPTGNANGSISNSTRTSTTTLVTGSNTTLSTTITGNGNGSGNGSASVSGNGQRNDSGSDTHTLRGSHSHTHSQSHSQSSHRHRASSQQQLQLQQPNSIPVYVRLWFHDSAEPGLKVARVTSEATLKWSLVAVVEDIFSLYKESEQVVRMEIVGFPKGYHMRFETEHEMKSFISYLGIYIRLTVKWMQDLCPSYKTPSLEELDRLYCHGPIGGGYSFMKLHENGDKCGSYIVRQCDREYNAYYIDINTRIVARNIDHERCQTETFKIIRKDKQWKLAYNGDEHIFEQLPELAQFIRTDSNDRIRIPASKYDKPPLLLLCLPKNLKTKKTEMELSEAELQRKNPQLFNPKTDLQWYRDSINHSDDDKVFTMRGDWIQQGSFKDVPVTMKMLKYDANFQEFMQLAHTWSLIQSPQFIKLYGLTLSVPYTMVMEYSKYGPLNKFLQVHRDISMYCLLDVMHGLVRGMHYLEDNKIIHNYIRCANLYVTKYDPEKYVLDAKISDPGYPRPYKQSDSPWIPIKYFNNLEAAKQDSSTQLWAFATTIYEIFSRGQFALDRLKQLDLIQNRARDGGILKQLHKRLCPGEMYETIMDGWSDDPDKRFSHHVIFTRLNAIKTSLQRNYDVPETEAESLDGDDGDFNGEFTAMSNGHGLPNGRHESECQMDDSISNNLFSGPGEFFANSHDLPLVMQLSDCKVIYREKDKIGQGHYGTVFRGEVEYHDRSRPTEQVAIKKLKTVQVTNDFIREMDIMRKLDHPNVVKFKYWAEKSLSIIMEYFEFGSFIVYLSSRKPSLTNARLLDFALDIARGMNYLSSKGLIHRDLAARNILVDRSCVKISDFGLAQFANADGYYIGISNRDIPIKWYSPEAIETNKFSSYSDVWSYGVTLFEMFSRGEIPNLPPPKKETLPPTQTLTPTAIPIQPKSSQELTQDDFLNRLRNGDRLEKPELCSDFVYNELMRPCWHETPKSRPTFYQIIQIIQSEIGDNVATQPQQQQQQQQHQQLQQQAPSHHRSTALEYE
ncbi:tyrosine-protein kinase hopscotch [Drosophila innubila]|uniref:tyrosine-protein kinase hopscotch n=1 Tax=Drosophila innubila TaxID=198719 RepID=UPI00148C9D6B|nr:tyrosine-protein kinase hopscotch [Drosophila innubila]XP_034487760.1 tyrosine-protein kinase hopscotch [Drosophila innubila]